MRSRPVSGLIRHLLYLKGTAICEAGRLAHIVGAGKHYFPVGQAFPAPLPANYVSISVRIPYTILSVSAVIAHISALL